jgi:hypothetical protein
MYKHLFTPILTKLMYIVLFIYLVILRTIKQLLNLEFASLCSYFFSVCVEKYGIVFILE